jgi:hypothetical protein
VPKFILESADGKQGKLLLGGATAERPEDNGPPDPRGGYV